MKDYYRGLYLLYIARQGYWVKEGKASFPPLPVLLAPYLLSSLGIALIFPLIDDLLLAFLRTQTFLDLVTYETVLYGTMLVIVSAGITYENYFVKLSQTQETLSLFFGMRGWQFETILFVKNILLVLPVLVLATFFNPWPIWDLFVLSHVLGWLVLRTFFPLKLTLPKLGLSWSYILSVLDQVSVLKALAQAMLTQSLFMVLYSFSPAYFPYRPESSFLVGIVLGFLTYQGKGLPYYFLSLIKDIPYLTVSGLAVRSWLSRELAGMMALSFALSLIPLPYLVWSMSLGIFETLLLVCGLLVSFLTCQGQQLVLSWRFRDKDLQTVGQVNAYPLSWSERWRFFLQQSDVPVLLAMAWFFRGQELIYSLFLGSYFLFRFARCFHQTLNTWVN